MEQTRQEAVQMLSDLKAVKFTEPTAQELHSSRPGRTAIRSSRPGLSRVHRQEMKRYKLGIERKKAKLTKNISEIDSYLQSVSDYESYEGKPKHAPVVLPVPVVVVGKKPVLKKTRLPRYTRRRRFR